MKGPHFSSFNLNPWTLAFCASTTILLLQIVVSQQGVITNLRQDNALHQQARGIEAETIRDLMYELDQIKLKSQFDHHSGYISGVVDSVNRRDYYSEVWHSGYSRGVDVQKYVDSLDRKDTKYTSSESEESEPDQEAQ